MIISNKLDFVQANEHHLIIVCLAINHFIGNIIITSNTAWGAGVTPGVLLCCRADVRLKAFQAHVLRASLAGLTNSQKTAFLQRVTKIN